MCHFLQTPLPQPLAVRLLPRCVVAATPLAVLVLAPSPKLCPSPCFLRALGRAVPISPVAPAAERKLLAAQGAASQDKLVHSPAGQGEVDTGERT